MKNLFASRKFFTLLSCMVLAVAGLYLGCILNIYRGDDGSRWKLVNTPGFGDDNNSSVVAMAEYNDYLYAMTRNKYGAEVWRMNRRGKWEQVPFPNGATNGFYGNAMINNVWGRMIVFKDKLYFGASSGFQGTYLYSTACEIWRYDGENWEPVISDKKDVDESGTITGISGCEAADGDPSAQITDSTKTWTPDQWQGAMLQVASENGMLRKFYILGNTATTLTIQQDEAAGTGATQDNETEDTVCSETTLTNPFPAYSYTLGAIAAGDTYEIGSGTDESGFGDFWNKTVTGMTIIGDRLYVSTGLNYARGSQVWYTDDGDTWTVTTPPNSFGNYHDNPDYPDGKKAVSSSLPSMAASSCSGEETLYASGTGTSGNKGPCARVAKLTDTGWELIVDNTVDNNTTGTNENGVGDCPGSQAGNFMLWSMVEFQDKLFAITNSPLGGLRILYTENGGSADGSWHYAVGCPTGTPAAECESQYPNGFDGELWPNTTLLGPVYRNISGYLFVFDDTLYCGTLQYFELGVTNNANIWKSKDGLTWTKITGDAFRDDQVVMFEGFASYRDKLYVSGSKSANTELISLGGAKVYCQERASRR